MQNYDTIIIGAGHNGLICAAYLAKSGQRVLVLEASGQLGGLAASREFHPGFKASVAHSVSHFSAKVAQDLNLASHGFDVAAKPMPTIGLNSTGDHVVIKGHQVTGVSAKDAQQFGDYRRFIQRFVELLKPFWLKTMPRIGNNSLPELMTFAQLGLKMRLLGKEDMGEFMRIATLPARDLMDENFDNDILKAALSWDGLIGSKMAPRSPNATILALLYQMSGEHAGAHAIPPGGIEALVNAIASAATAAGAEIKTHSPVARITTVVDKTLCDGFGALAANGVELESGETITATRVISATDPKRTFIDLLGVENLEIEFTNRIKRLRTDGYVAKLHLALSGEPTFTGLEQANGRMIIAPKLDAIEFAYDDAKYGGLPENPVMEIVVPSLHNGSQAPAGQHVLSAHVMYVPNQLKGGWNDEAKAVLTERVINTLASYAPDIRQQIIHSELLTPADLEKTHLVSGGHWHHSEFSADQLLMMRPTYQAAQYSTPMAGLYLCSAGSHPGGGLMGAAGHNAAKEVLK
ncbi:phytoene desaturase family protein [Oceanicoccus sagamiensis]|uniref:Pyridine nucleotide-disulfide oxidoreductase domain-containing protein 2 n=1 Tax=Oceanicoccus sagamiensis TaxID=716816 RepID=A0A1X9NF68_9GAMM|nr:NAD(P)/FAD-dependent oxidoreductase [Oceanicoccus sagamiensis]ARN72673.1 phytoene dehydrogenase [Oceanicoccus sagamiensis]